MTKGNIITVVGSALVVAILLMWGCNEHRKRVEQDVLMEAASDTLNQFRTKNGELITSIKEFSTASEKDFLNLKTQDSTIKWLQREVKQYKGKLQAATVASTTTTDKGTTVTITKTDTVLIEGKPQVKPVYETAWNDQWSAGVIEAHWDSIHRNIKTKNEFTFTHGYKRKWFKKDVLTVEMKNLNPNTVTTELRSYSVAVPKKRFSIGLGAAYGFDMLHLGQTTVVVGVTGSFTLIKF